MLAVAKVIYKERFLVEGFTKLVKRKEVFVKEHFDLVVDEISEGRTSQQTIWVNADNVELVSKLDNLSKYEEIYIIVNIDFFEGRPNQIVCLDIMTDEADKKNINNILNNYRYNRMDWLV